MKPLPQHIFEDFKKHHAAVSLSGDARVIMRSQFDLVCIIIIKKKKIITTKTEYQYYRHYMEISILVNRFLILRKNI